MAMARSLVAAWIRVAAAAAAGKPPSVATAGGTLVRFQTRMTSVTAPATTIGTAASGRPGPAVRHVRHAAAMPIPTSTKTIGSAKA